MKAWVKIISLLDEGEMMMEDSDNKI